jgi:hypothetical protein
MIGVGGFPRRAAGVWEVESGFRFFLFLLVRRIRELLLALEFWEVILQTDLPFWGRGQTSKYFSFSDSWGRFYDGFRGCCSF